MHKIIKHIEDAMLLIDNNIYYNRYLLLNDLLNYIHSFDSDIKIITYDKNHTHNMIFYGWFSNHFEFDHFITEVLLELEQPSLPWYLRYFNHHDDMYGSYEFCTSFFDFSFKNLLRKLIFTKDYEFVFLYYQFLENNMHVLIQTSCPLTVCAPDDLWSMIKHVPYYTYVFNLHTHPKIPKNVKLKVLFDRISPPSPSDIDVCIGDKFQAVVSEEGLYTVEVKIKNVPTVIRTKSKKYTIQKQVLNLNREEADIESLNKKIDDLTNEHTKLSDLLNSDLEYVYDLNTVDILSKLAENVKKVESFEEKKNMRKISNNIIQDYYNQINELIKNKQPRKLVDELYNRIEKEELNLDTESAKYNFQEIHRTKIEEGYIYFAKKFKKEKDLYNSSLTKSQIAKNYADYFTSAFNGVLEFKFYEWNEDWSKILIKKNTMCYDGEPDKSFDPKYYINLRDVNRYFVNIETTQPNDTFSINI